MRLEIYKERYSVKSTLSMRFVRYLYKSGGNVRGSEE
jgi:hypothetical protein